MEAEKDKAGLHYGMPVRTVSVGDLSMVDFRSLTEAGEPVLLKNLTGQWPVTQAASQSDQSAADYLLRFYAGHPVTVYKAAAEAAGKFFYNADGTGFNFVSGQLPLNQILNMVMPSQGAPSNEALYIGSTDLDHFFPGFGVENNLQLDPLGEYGRPVMGSIWIGNQTVATAHFDISNNIACCVAGRRRFTLFPPDQIANLYPGPLEPTPAGQVVSMVDLFNPDLERFPGFAVAMENAQIAEMEPGDVLVYPAMWWHQVEALSPFNILVNYWWNAVPAHFDTPMNTLQHALLSLRDRPEYEKAAWRELFDYYVFGDPETPRRHLPGHMHGELAPMDDTAVARRLRAKLLNRLNR
jgi:hypothetical protein